MLDLLPFIFYCYFRETMTSPTAPKLSTVAGANSGPPQVPKGLPWPLLKFCKVKCILDFCVLLIGLEQYRRVSGKGEQILLLLHFKTRDLLNLFCYNISKVVSMCLF